MELVPDQYGLRAEKRTRAHEWHKTLWRNHHPRNLFIGDSIAQMWTGDHPAAFAGGHTLNLGLGGEELAQIFARTADYGREWLSVRAVLVIAGTNDLTNGATGNEVLRKLKSLVRLIQARAPLADLIVSPIPPREPRRRYREEERGRVNRGLAKLSEAMGFICPDLEPLTDPTLRIDRTHFGPEGYAVFRTCIDRACSARAASAWASSARQAASGWTPGPEKP